VSAVTVRSHRQGEKLNLSEIADAYWVLLNEYQPTVFTTRGEHNFDHTLRRFDGDWLEKMSSSFRGIAAAAREVETSVFQDRVTAGMLAHESDMWATEI